MVSLTHQPQSTPQNHYLSASGTHFCQRMSKPQVVVLLEELVELKISFTSSGLEPATFQLVA
jgi:hypothetical protein